MRPAVLRLLVAIGAALVAVTPPAPVAAFLTTVRVDQKTYNAVPGPQFKGLVYLYVDDIESTRGTHPGFKPFKLHVLVGRARPPLLGTKAFMRLEDLEQLLKKRNDVWRDSLVVTDLAGQTKTVSAPNLPAFTLRIQRVVPESFGTDHVLVDIP